MKNLKKASVLLFILILALTAASCGKKSGSADGSKISDYFTFEENIIFYYSVSVKSLSSEDEPEKNLEWAAYNDYIENNKLQRRYMAHIDNSFAYTGEVYELKNGELLNIFYASNFYDHTNLLSEKSNTDVLLLKEPLKEGQTWTFFQSGDIRETAKIVAMDRNVTVPYGTFSAMVVEITDKSGNLVSTHYWVKELGLVKKVNRNSDNIQTQEITNIEKDMPLAEQIYLVYGEDSEGEPQYEIGIVTYPTNIDVREIYLAAAKEYLSTKFEYKLDDNVKINDIEFDRLNNKLKIDMSSAFISEMNKAGDKERVVLQALVNTLGSLYSAIDVCINVDGKAYESKYIKLGIDEYIRMTFYQEQ